MKSLDADIEQAIEYARMLAGLDDNSTEEYRSRLVYLQQLFILSIERYQSDLTKDVRYDSSSP